MHQMSFIQICYWSLISSMSKSSLKAILICYLKIRKNAWRHLSVTNIRSSIVLPWPRAGHSGPSASRIPGNGICGARPPRLWPRSREASRWRRRGRWRRRIGETRGRARNVAHEFPDLTEAARFFVLVLFQIFIVVIFASSWRSVCGS